MNNNNCFSLSISELDDTIISNPQNNDVLKYNASTNVWQNSPNLINKDENNNLKVGVNNGNDISNGEYNTLVGYDNAEHLNTGDFNIVQGSQNDIQTSDEYNIVLGNLNNTNGKNECILFGNSITAQEDQCLHLGSSSHQVKTDNVSYGGIFGNLILYVNGQRVAIQLKTAS
jgi:hypothetical protein